MAEDNTLREKRPVSLKHSQTDSSLQRGVAATKASGNQPSSAPASLRRPQGLFHTLTGKLFKTGSARESSNLVPPVISSNGQDPPCIQTNQTPSSLAAPTFQANSGQGLNSPAASVGPTDPELVMERLGSAQQGLAEINRISGIARHTASATANADSVLESIDTFSDFLKPLKVFNSIITGIAEVHPYAKVALTIFASASKMILDQADRDVAVSRLLSKVSEVFSFMVEEEALKKIPSMLAIYGKIAQQTLQCADFITHYSETTSAWKRLGENIFKETDATIQSFSDNLDNLMQQFRDQVARDAVIILHRSAEDLDFSGMEYASAAGLNTTKHCLPGTREDILSKIKSWISETGEDVLPVLWLSGTAGKGKSAIAHTIANWSKEAGCLGACFCFDRTRVADRRHEKIFTTVARDLADCNPAIRRALANAVRDNNELKHTADITRQWRELIIGPIRVASTVVTAPVLIVIDALDESGNDNSREQILRLLTTQLTKLPGNFRVIITSRPLEDIHKSLHTASHVHHLSMDDISSESTTRDIQRYVSDKLGILGDVFNDEHFHAIAQKSDGLFEWARLACEYIKGTNKIGRGPMRRFEAVVANAVVDGTSAKGTHLLDVMYQRILAEIMPQDDDEGVIPMFQSVMGQIIASHEPLTKAALTSMRLHFPWVDSSYEVDDVIRPMGSLITGTVDSQTPIRPLHASFYDFLTDTSRSDKFFIEVSSAERDLAFASLGVMKQRLRFNICSLESSYLPNSAVHDLDERVKDSIPAELSYSCRFWGTHVRAAPFEPLLAREVEAFFDEERLLFWMEVLGLIRSVGSAARSLVPIPDWCTGHAEYMQITDAARDTLRFIRMFGAAISHSTPHLYLSALPLTPTQSRMYMKFAAMYPRTPQVVDGHIAKWPATEKVIRMHGTVRGLAISQDGKCIVGGSSDGEIQVWDMETGEALGAPLRGHTGAVFCVAISPDGKRIVSGSEDNTIRVWDTETSQTLGTPLQGHTGFVYSVAISSNGKRIVSGSGDGTIRVWDMETGETLGSPFLGQMEDVNTVAITPDGKRIVSGSDNTTIRVWDVETGETVGAPFLGHTSYVLSVAISSDGHRLVSGSDDNTILVWDMETGEAFGAPLKGHDGPVNTVAIWSDRKRIISGSHDSTLRVWNAETGEAVGAPLRGHIYPIFSVAISPDGTHIVSGSSDQTIRVWNVETGEPSVAPLRGHDDFVRSVAISPDGKCIVSGSKDNTIRVWDTETSKPLVAPLQGHTDQIRSVVISSDGKRIVSGSRDNAIRVWDAKTGETLGAPFVGHIDSVLSVAISSDGNRIVSGSADDTILVWDMETRKTLGAPFLGHTSIVLSVAISSDGHRVVSGSDDHTIRVWDMDTGESLGVPLRGHNDAVYSVAISSDRKHIVSGSYDRTIRIWNAETGEAVGASLLGHTSVVLFVAISPDGKHIVSGSQDNTIRLWDMQTGEALGTPLRGHSGGVASVAISPDRMWMVSGSFDRSIRVWDLEFLHNHPRPRTPTICFSTNPAYALCSAFSFLGDSCAPLVSLAPNEDEWVVGPEGRLLFWIPSLLYPAMHFPGTKSVISNDASELDLSHFAHGTSWEMCRERGVESSS